jgi:hypothetical protein
LWKQPRYIDDDEDDKEENDHMDDGQEANENHEEEKGSCGPTRSFLTSASSERAQRRTLEDHLDGKASEQLEEVIRAKVTAEANREVAEAKQALQDDFLNLEYDVAKLEACVESLYRDVVEETTIKQHMRNNIQTFRFKSTHKRCDQCARRLQGQDTRVVQNECGAVSVPCGSCV